MLPRFTNEAIEVIERHAENKGHATADAVSGIPGTTYPVVADDEFVGKSGAGMYGDFVMMVDAQVGRVLATSRQSRHG